MKKALILLVLLPILLFAGCSSGQKAAETPATPETITITPVSTATTQSAFPARPLEKDFATSDEYIQAYVEWMTLPDNPFVTTLVPSSSDDNYQSSDDNYQDFAGDAYTFREVSGIFIPDTSKTVTLTNTLVLDKSVSEFNGIEDGLIADVSWPVAPGYYNVQSDWPYEAKETEQGKINLHFSVPTEVEEFTVSVSYRFSDIFVSKDPIGHRPDSRLITEDSRLYEIAKDLTSVDDLFAWMSQNLTYLEGQTTRTNWDDPRSDIEVLEAGGGDCDELATFLVSLAAKMPDPIDGCVVFGWDMDRIVEADGHISGIQIGHAIAQLKLGGQWVAIDATVLVCSNIAACTYLVPGYTAIPRLPGFVDQEAFNYVMYSSKVIASYQ